MIKLSQLLKEMAETDLHFQNVINAYQESDENKKAISNHLFPNQPVANLAKVKNELSIMDYDDIVELEKQVGIYNLEEKEKPGLWANIRAKRARGEKPARKGSQAFKKAVKAAKEINKNK